MPIQVKCQQCARMFRLKDEYKGRKFKCTDCGVIVVANPVNRPAADHERQAASQTAQMDAATQPTKTEMSVPKKSGNDAQLPPTVTKKRSSSPAKQAPGAKSEATQKTTESNSFAALDRGAGSDHEEVTDSEGSYRLRRPQASGESQKQRRRRRRQAITETDLDVVVASDINSKRRLPSMAFNLNKWNTTLALLGVLGVFWGVHSLSQSLQAGFVPYQTSLSELASEGLKGRTFLTVTEIRPTAVTYVANESNTGLMTEVWVACAPGGTRGLTDFVLYSTECPTETHVSDLMNAGTHTGMIVGQIHELSEEMKERIHGGLERINMPTAYIFEVGRAPASFARCMTYIVGGVLLLLFAGIWVLFLHG